MSELDNCVVQDADGENLGRLIDAVLARKENGMRLTKFVVGDSRLVEFLERIGIRKDVDPVFDTSVIASMSPRRIKLNVGKDELKATHLDDDVLDDNEFKLTSLRRTPVFDSNDQNIGRIIDIKFIENTFQLILGDSIISEWAEDVGIQDDVDFLIAPKYIDEFSKDKIVLTKPKNELKSTFILNIEKIKSDADDELRRANAIKGYYFPSTF